MGVPAAQPRRTPQTEGLIGFFVNTLVLRTDLSGDPPFPGVLGPCAGSVSGGVCASRLMPFGRRVVEAVGSCAGT